MKLRSGLFFLLILLAALTVAPQITHAAAITINSLADNTTSGNSLCTLREAINNANSDSDTTGGDCVAGSGADSLTFSLSGTITLSSTLPNITSAITIDGTGQTLSISGNDSVRVFRIASGGNLSLSNLTVQDGNAGQFFGDRGGAVFNVGGTLTATNVTFLSNAANEGGAIYTDYTSTSTTITNSTFTGNSAVYSGGAVYAFNSTINLTNVTFTGNTANEGGGIYNWGVINLTSSTLSGNTAPSGGAVFNYGSLNVTTTTLSGNSAADGAAIYNYSASGVTMTSSTVTGNTASNDGGGFYASYGGVLTVTKSTLSGNSASNRGGGFYTDGTTVNLTSSTLFGNSAPTVGGVYRGISVGGGVYMAGMVLDTGANGANCNNFVFDNGYNVSDDSSCGFDEDYRHKSSDNGVLNLNALANNEGGIAQTHSLAAGSAAIGVIPNGITVNNHGVTLACNNSTTDQNGIARPRIANGACSSGAVEATEAVISCASPANITTASQLNNCMIWANAYPGASTLNLGASITLSAQMPYIIDQTTLNGAGYFLDGNNSVRLLRIGSTATVTIHNLTVQHGSAAQYAGGILNTGSLTLTNVTISNNMDRGIHNAGTLMLDNVTVSDNTGGGILNYATLNMMNSTVSNNSSSDYGGGIYNRNHMTVTDSTISNNSSNTGGGIYSDSSSTIMNSTISDNTATNGGGVFSYVELTITNSTLSGNSASTSGGGFYNAGDMTITHTTLSGNSASTSGGGFYNYDGDPNDPYPNIVYVAGVVLDKGANGANCLNDGGITINNGYNLSDDNSCGFSGSGSANNAVLNLGPLQNNGGSTLTHLPGTGSAAINLIPNGTIINNNGVTYTCNQNGEVLDTDQRGQTRPATAAGACDAGSVEVAAVGSPEIVVEAPGPVNIGDGSTYNMGTTTVGTPINRTITVRNTGTANLTLSASAPTVTGSFTAGNFGSTTLAPNASTTFSLSCTAASVGSPASGTISFGNNDGDENPFNFTVQCTVNSLTAEIAVEAPGSVNIPDSGSYDLGTTSFGMPIAQTITVRNLGATNLTISTNPPTVTGNFSASNFGATTIATNASTTFTVRCLAMVAGVQTGTISFANNDTDENPFNFTITCTVNESPAGAVPERGYYTTHTPTLTWNPLTGVTTYDVQMADNPGFTGATTHSAINGLSFTTPALPNGVHYWRVRAAGTANWSATQRIVVAAP